MEYNSWVYLILIPLAVNIASTILYDFVKPRYLKWRASVSVSAAQARIDEAKARIAEVHKHRGDFELLVTVATREVLRALWSIFITGIALVIYVLLQTLISDLATRNSVSANTTASISMGLRFGALGFFWGHFTKSTRRVLFHYRLVRDVIDFEDFEKRMSKQIERLEQTIKSLT